VDGSLTLSVGGSALLGLGGFCYLSFGNFWELKMRGSFIYAFFDKCLGFRSSAGRAHGCRTLIVFQIKS